MGVKIQHGVALGAAVAPAPTPTPAPTLSPAPAAQEQSHDNDGSPPWHGAPLGDYKPPVGLPETPAPSPTQTVLSSPPAASQEAPAQFSANLLKPSAATAKLMQAVSGTTSSPSANVVVESVNAPPLAPASMEIQMGKTVVSMSKEGNEPVDVHGSVGSTEGMTQAEVVANNAKEMPLWIIGDNVEGKSTLVRAKNAGAALNAVVEGRFEVRKATVNELLALLPNTIKVVG